MVVIIEFNHSNSFSFSQIGDQLIAKRRNERFKRIKCSTLARLLRESLAEESIYQLNRDGPISGEVQASDSVSQRGAQMQPMSA